MPLATEILGALVAGALIFAVARQLGAEPRRAFGAVSLVAVSVAAVLAVPGLRDDVSAMLHQRDEYGGMSQAEAQVRGGSDLGINVGFLGWIHEHMKEGETFRLEIGTVPGEELFEGAGVNQATNFAWATYQLAPNLLVGQSASVSEMESGEAQSPDWVVFYGKSPDQYEGKLGEVLTYEPNFAIARTADAG